ncbi:MAG: hypothetical protein ABI693_07310 [Bryobacteraceae bacterium]
MSNSAAVAKAMGGVSATNGWDAAYAMNLKQVNALLLQQFLRDGPTHGTRRLCVILPVEDDFWILDVTLGPPEFSFLNGGQQADLTMDVVSGSLIAFDSDQTIRSAVLIRPNESKLTGPVALSKVKGEVNQLGGVVLDLGATAYNPSICGVDPTSQLNKDIGAAVQTFFAASNAKFALGSIATDNVPSALSPTSFNFWIQPKPNSQDACLLLLVKTTGSEGTVGPLPVYPIPDNSGAALMISGRALFNGVMVETLNATFKQFGTKFTGQQSSGTWSSVVASGGAVDFGKVGTEKSRDDLAKAKWNTLHLDPWSDGNVTFPLNGLKISLAPSSGGLSAVWNCQVSHSWSEWTSSMIGRGKMYFVRNESVEVVADYSQSFSAPTVDSTNDMVAFQSASPKVTLNYVHPWREAFFGSVLRPAFVAGLQKALQETLANFQLPSVNAFALVNLLFPAHHYISLKEAHLPNDLYLTGTLAQPIAVTPVDAMAAPGGTLQFTATGTAAADIVWEISPRSPRGGSVSPTGLYTAPASISVAEVVVVKAVSRKDPSKDGSAMVLVHQIPAVTGIAVAPASCVVTPGRKVHLTATNAAGQGIAVNWTLTPNIGQISSGFGHRGEYAYAAPDKIAEATTVTASAVSPANPSLTGVAAIQVTPRAVVTVTAAQSSVKPGATVALTAKTTVGDIGDLRWVVYPIDGGTVAPNPDDPSKATYTAPAKAGKQDPLVVAYLVDDEAAGLSSASIKVTA